MNSINTNLGYSGRVKIKYKIGNKTYDSESHNEGTSNLFKLFAMALSGNSVGSLIPYQVSIQYSTDGGANWIDFLNSNSFVRELKYLQEENVWKTRFVASVFYNQMQNISLITSDDVRAVVYNRDGEALAYMTIAKSKLTQMSAGSQMIIEWTMTVDNQSNS